MENIYSYFRFINIYLNCWSSERKYLLHRYFVVAGYTEATQEEKTAFPNVKREQQLRSSPQGYPLA